MTIPPNLACKEGLVYIPQRARGTCCQNRYERPYMNSDNLEGKYLLAFILAVQQYKYHQLYDYYYFCAVLFTVDW